MNYRPINQNPKLGIDKWPVVPVHLILFIIYELYIDQNPKLAIDWWAIIFIVSLFH